MFNMYLNSGSLKGEVFPCRQSRQLKRRQSSLSRERTLSSEMKILTRYTFCTLLSDYIAECWFVLLS